MRQHTRRLHLVAPAMALWSQAAVAHSPIKGLGTFYDSMLHPFVVPAHALFLIATALMLGQQGRQVAPRGVLLLALGLTVGLLISGTVSMSERVLLVGALLIGGAVSFGRSLPHPIVWGAACLCGLMIGLDSAPEPSAARVAAALAYAGLVTGILYTALVIPGLTVGVEQQWQRVGVRIIGSWIVAVAVIVLAVEIRRSAALDTAGPIPGVVRQC